MLDGLTGVEKGDLASIVRVVWDWHAMGSSANNQVFGRFGWHVITQDAFDAGAVPDPLADPPATVVCSSRVWLTHR